MEDKLSKFIARNREAFEEEGPPDSVWEKLSSQLGPFDKQVGHEAKVLPLHPQVRFWRYVAAVLLVTASGLSVYIYNREKMMPMAEAPPKLQELAPELAQAEAYYTSQIAEKSTQLSKYDLRAMGLGENPEADLRALDSSYQQLKRQLLGYKGANNQQLVAAMIQNLQIRMQLLNEQLEVLKKIESYQKPNSLPKDNEKTNL
jgi:hypothetical protein